MSDLPPPSAKRSAAPFAALIGLAIALGVFFRFYQLGDTLLWHDEVATRIFAAGYTPDAWRTALYTGEVFDVSEVQKYQQYNAGTSVLGTIHGLMTDDPQHPPLYYVLIRVWVGVMGDGAAALRLLSALLSLAALPGMFWLCKELFGSARVAWIGTALAATSPFFVLYAREAREYALWSALILLSSAALLRALRRADGPRPAVGAWALYASLLLLSLYTSFSTVGLILAHVLFVAFNERLRPTPSSIGFIGALTVSGAAFTPWALAFWAHYEAFEVSMRWSREIIIPNSSLFRILAFNGSRTLVDFWAELDNAPAWLATGLAVALIGVAFARLVRGGPPRAAVFVVVCVAVPIGMMLGPDLLFGGIRSVSSRYMTPSWIGVQLALAYLLAEGLAEGRGRTGLLAMVLAVGLASSASNTGRAAVWTKGTSQGLPRVAELINASEAPLVIGDNERHNPGNLMALSNLLRPDTRMQFLTIEMQEGYQLPADREIFLYSPIPPFRDQLEAREGVRATLLYEDLHLTLWRLER